MARSASDRAARAAFDLPSSQARDPLWFVRDREAFVQRFILAEVLAPPPSRAAPARRGAAAGRRGRGGR